MSGQDRTKAKDLARGKWPSVLSSLGIDADVLEGRKHHPCPKDKTGVDRFRFADRDGTGSYFCECSDGSKGGMALLMCCKGWNYAEAAKEVERVVGDAVRIQPRVKADPRERLNTIRKCAKPAGDIVRSYLAARGLECPDALRQARQVYWDGQVKVGTFDVMVAKVVAPDGLPETYHLTYLVDGKKADLPSPRKMLTPARTVTGGAVRLYPAGPHLGIAEGIETAIAAYMVFGIPVWSVLNANGIKSFLPPPGTERLTIFADNDTSFVGQAAAFDCAKRLSARPYNLQCDVRVPDQPDTDWNDELLRRERAA